MSNRFCVDCDVQFDPCDSLMGDECQCQMCWEEQCDRSWWTEMKRLDETLGPIVERSEHPIPLEVRGDIAAFLQACGRPYGCSTFIDEVTTTRGYRRLDEFGFWEFPL